MKTAMRWVLGWALGVAACGGTAGTDPTFLAGEAARRAVLADMADGAILPTLAAFETAAQALVTATEALAEAPEDAVARNGARAAWMTAMKAWQVAEVMQLGPATPAGDGLGGEDFRDRIYAWPLFNACRLDQETLAESYADPAAVSARLANIRGLAAVEALLFAPDGRNACPITAELNTSGRWEALGEATLTARRAAHAEALARDIAAQASALRAAWAPSGEAARAPSAPTGGDFRGAFAEAGVRTTPFATAQEALNHVSNALFYLDKEVKDGKIGTPLGYFDCPTDTCPERFESRASQHTRANLEANLRGFRLLFSGADTSAAARAHPKHFVALLTEAGAGDLAAAMLEATDAVEARLAEITTDLESALAREPERVEAVYAAVKGLTDLLKTQFVGTLDLDLPNRAEGDND